MIPSTWTFLACLAASAVAEDGPQKDEARGVKSEPGFTLTAPEMTLTLVPDEPYGRNPLVPQPTAFGIEDRQTTAGPGTTLQQGWYWIRAVAAPNYHKYLQTKPAVAAGTALLESYTSAGQFNVVDRQLVENTGGQPLYMWVEKPVSGDFTQRTLATWFNTTKNTFGAFAFQGDALTWSAPEVQRQNVAAWLVCKNQALFINTGAYAYQTPAGCSDQTVRRVFPGWCMLSEPADLFPQIHYYNDAHANN
ncbi:hypothetical protein PG994_012907 [Apiospora phragmitis]|uniref:Uncharacterized protein n=1 Tax=Apiospora phragmitis TaxID=2905665 RepID=A0ABR1T9B9_9PEZI